MSRSQSRGRPPSPPPPADELVLAAVERAARHRAREVPAVPSWAILEHLDVPRRSAAARALRARLDALEEIGWLEPRRLHGIAMWQLTDAGARHLRRARRGGGVPGLPESPQHRDWRAARTLAGQEIERFRGQLRARLLEALTLLDADEPGARSDDLLEAGEGLQRAAWRLACATYCLFEWREPEDERADLETLCEPGDELLSEEELRRRRARRRGRRNLRRWAGGA